MSVEEKNDDGKEGTPVKYKVLKKAGGDGSSIKSNSVRKQ